MPKDRNLLQKATRRSRRIADRQRNNNVTAVAPVAAVQELNTLMEMAAPVAAAAVAPDAPMEVAASVAAAAPAPDAPIEVAAQVVAADIIGLMRLMARRLKDIKKIIVAELRAAEDQAEVRAEAQMIEYRRILEHVENVLRDKIISDRNREKNIADHIFKYIKHQSMTMSEK
ncbi:hypothetical protein RF55_19757 [Lasius niger]|uniref:Uncharacterized protein n=1 Tax=Lasius niger TaxID=67767 RepID=A0A0J7JZN6_LASNI|nr:hypothetical protein RF55_19757 [Lasius niger]